ncbi:ABC transporter ATP-binding protein [Chitinimonas naiadis]
MIEFDQVGKSFGSRIAIDHVSLCVKQGEFVVLLGRSGSGKSTTLRLINRLLEADTGQIRLAGQDIRELDPHALRRRMGYAIQSVGLFPHWSVARNVATVPQLLGWPQARIAQRVDELLHLLHLDPAIFRDRLPHQLSGGQQQRVGVARALAADPEVLLMDEPFGALDPQTRTALQDEVARIHRQARTTIIMVTHDIDEALRLADRIILLEQGRIAQQGTPRELLTSPVSAPVLAFLGDADLGIQRLALHGVLDCMRQGGAPKGPVIASTATLREALSLMLHHGVDQLAVQGSGEVPLGSLHLADLVGSGRQ